MDLNALTAISPVDGRYRNKVEGLAQYYSEFGLIRYRVKVEILYFISLCEKPVPQLKGVEKLLFDQLKAIYENFTEEDALKIKEIEKTTNHDVKAVEYFLKEKFDMLRLSDHKEFIHFGLTSQDINNTAIPLLLKDSLVYEVYPLLDELISLIYDKAEEWKEIPMLARTHGQPASPTRLGKEIRVFHERLVQQTDRSETIPFAAKFGGATGNFNAHYVAYPDTDWHSFGNKFVESYLGLTRSRPTTQIEHYDHLAALFDSFKRINTILLDFSKDIWQYVAMNYFKQKINKDEVGSSAMPHKVNPIDFENAEGNLGIANALFIHLGEKLPVSRLQRDLTDSTVLRNIGVPIAHTVIALRSLVKGIGKLQVNEVAIRTDLEENWAVVAEAIQTVLRREAYPQPYEALKALTRTGDAITEGSIKDFIKGLEVDDHIREELERITPFNFTGK